MDTRILHSFALQTKDNKKPQKWGVIFLGLGVIFLGCVDGGLVIKSNTDAQATV